LPCECDGEHACLTRSRKQFESVTGHRRYIAQWEERCSDKAKAGGSIPSIPMSVEPSRNENSEEVRDSNGDVGEHIMLVRSELTRTTAMLQAKQVIE
jgi:hypothetical protein